MDHFSSPRERRLWLFAGITLIGILSTLALNNVLAEFFVSIRGLIDVTFIYGFGLILVAILVQGLKGKASGPEIGVLMGIMAVYFLVFLRMGVATERSHLVEYSILALCIYEALLERKQNGRGVPAPALLAFAITVAIGWLDELVQLFIPNRVYDLVDVGFNAMAAVMAIGGRALFGWVRRRWTQSKEGA